VTEQLSIPTPAGSFDAIAAGPADGRPVLLLHGFPEAALSWEHQVAVLGSRGYRAVAPDQRGYSPGVRPEAVAEYGISELVGDVLAITDEIG
jgi:pimeloyl-ACP methyl ester carboxylesterase